MDARLYRSINSLAARTGWAHGFFTATARYGIVLFGAALLVGWWSARSEGSPGAMAAVVWAGGASLVALGLAQLIGGAIDRARPYTAMPASHVLVARTSDFSFPSDHSTVVGAVAVGLVLAGHRYRSPRLGRIVCFGAVVLAFSRVYVGVHYPGDVIAGLALGGATAALGLPLATRLLAPLATHLAESPLRRLVVAKCVRPDRSESA